MDKLIYEQVLMVKVTIRTSDNDTWTAEHLENVLMRGLEDGGYHDDDILISMEEIYE